jgi:hypothetical protein
VRGNQVFGERLRATTDNTTSSDDDFFPEFGNLNLGDNQDTTAANIAATAAAAANAGRYTFLSSSFQILLEFLVLLFGVDAIGLSCLDAICSSNLLICMISLSAVYIVMIYQVLVRINSYDNLLIYSTVSTTPKTKCLGGGHKEPQMVKYESLCGTKCCNSTRPKVTNIATIEDKRA